MFLHPEANHYKKLGREVITKDVNKMRAGF
jgi:hypothetical protein